MNKTNNDEFIANDNTVWPTQISATQRNILLWSFEGLKTKEDLLELSNYCAGYTETFLSPVLKAKLFQIESPVLQVWDNWEIVI